MSVVPIRCGIILGVLAIWQVQDSASQFVRNVPRTGSVSRARSSAYEREINYGPVEFSGGVAKSRTVTKSNGGFRNGGVTSVSKSNVVSRELELGPLDIGSTLTRSQTKTNGAVSRSLAHDLNIGNLNLETSLSRDNLRNGIGLQRSPDGGLKFGLGALSFGLSRNNQPDANAYTQAQAQAQGRNSRARANSNTRTQAQQYGNVGVTNTYSKSNAVSRTKHGQTSASTNGLLGVPVYGQGFRVRRAVSPHDSAPINAAPLNHRVRRTPSPQVTPVYSNQLEASQPEYVRSKRRAQFIPFVYPEDQRLQRPRLGRQPQVQNANAQGLANSKNDRNDQQAGAQTNQEIKANGITQNNGASSIGSNLATAGVNGQENSANIARMNAVTQNGSQSSNNIQSEALDFDANQQQASSGNAVTNHIINESDERVESNSGSQATNNNRFGTTKNIANTNAVANTSADTSSSGAGGGNTFTNARFNVGGGIDEFGVSANSGAFGNFGGAQGFATGQTGNPRALRRRQLNPAFKLQSGQAETFKIGTQNEESMESPQSSWPQNRSGQYPRYPTAGDNSSTEQFDLIDEKERHGRTFSLITDFIDSLTPRCVYPCTKEAYDRKQCCETVVIVPQPPPNACCQRQPMQPPPPIRPIPPIMCCQQYPIQPPPVLPPPQGPFPPPPQSIPRPPPVVIIPTPTITYPLLPSQCCTSCPAYGYYGPPPCTRFNMPRLGPGRVTLYVPPFG